MKYVISIFAFFCVAAVLGIFVVAGLGHFDQAAADQGKSGDMPDWECPIAAGVWYPQQKEMPDAPMRYYRVRCFPGCHSGSSLGMYPDQPLKGDHPIFPTSTIDGATD